MEELHRFIADYGERGACRCGRCADAGPDPGSRQPVGEHTANVLFFVVAARPGTDAEKLRELIKANVSGNHCNVDLFDGLPHDYTELGAWIGDQGCALMLMGLGSVLGLWSLLVIPHVSLVAIVPLQTPKPAPDTHKAA